ncbi:hypothetical protein [Hydrogenophaga sp.]|uniref:hypothetical protein n=1 Tax=Hydrogenophaga sp. TaxID=1904254 RepID=UPI002717D12B|nr:hypothetical protein [Hydrogenophaga sp.]MDO9436505.1 hypothetical protein [Hydrogenophaga sp.]
MKSRRWRFYVFVVAAAILLVTALGATAFFATDAGRNAYAEARNRSPQSLIRYTLRRLEGHPKLEWIAHPGLYALQRHYERTPPPGSLPTLGKGQQTTQVATPTADASATVRVDTEAGILDALFNAKPGTRIVIAPGQYRFNKTIRLGQDGRPREPISVRAIVPGSVRLNFTHTQGILVDRPYWTFENLDIRGACAPQEDCEHAFHVVGAAAFTTLRNNHLQDFNAHIKVNGLNGEWPDHGLVAFNTLTNASARQTLGSVVAFDLVGASHWKVQDNLVTNFAKLHGNRVAYGLFMKGAGESGRFERNLVICSPSGVSEPGERVGISFGGGGSDPGVCREDGCRAFEHRHGLAANNIVAHCNDSGIDVNGSSNIVVAHNTLINTAGFSARKGSTKVRLLSNLYEGHVSTQQSSLPEMEWNVKAEPATLFMNPDGLSFLWLDRPAGVPSRAFVTIDFKGTRREAITLPGALDERLP